MTEKKVDSLSYLRVYSLILIAIVFVFLLISVPSYIVKKSGIYGDSDGILSGDEEVLLSPPIPDGPCIDLDNPATFGTAVTTTVTGGFTDYLINKDVTLCKKTYTKDDANAPNNNGVVIINANNVDLNCNGALIRDNTPHSDDIAITASSKSDISLWNCLTEGFGKGVNFFNVQNSYVQNLNIKGNNNDAISLEDSNYNEFRKLVIKDSSINNLAGLRLKGSQYNTFYDISANNFLEHAIFLDSNSLFVRSSYNRIEGVNIDALSQADLAGVNGAIRLLNSPSNFLKNVSISSSVRGIVISRTGANLCGNDSIQLVSVIGASDKGIQIREPCNNVSIDGFVVDGSNNVGVEVRAHNVTLLNGIVKNTGANSESIDGGIVVTPTTGRITGTVFRNLTIDNNGINGILVRSGNATLTNVYSRNNDNNLNVRDFGNVSAVDSQFNDARTANIDVKALSGGTAVDIVNVHFVNSTFVESSIVSSASGTAGFRVQWWLDVFVDSTSGQPVHGAAVNIQDNAPSVIFSGITKRDGLVRKNVTEYTEKGGVKTFFHPYTVTVSKPPGAAQVRVVPIPASQPKNMFETFTFTGDFSFPLIYFTYPIGIDNTAVEGVSFDVNVSIDDEPDLVEAGFYLDNSLALIMNFNNRIALGESSSFVKDASGNNNDGSCAGGTCPIWNPVVGGAFKFDGVNDYFDVPLSPSISLLGGPISVAMWVKADVLGKDMHIVHEEGAFMLMILVDNRILFSSDVCITCGGGYIVSSPVNIADGKWHYVIGTFSGGFGSSVNTINAKIYLDGVSIGSSASGNWASGIAPISFTIGGAEHGGSVIGPLFGGFDGFIDELKIYTRVLTAQEVLDNYNLNKDIYDSSLVLMTNFDMRNSLEETDNFVKDASGNNNDGSCAGGTCPIWNPAGKQRGAFDFDGVDDRIDIAHSSSISSPSTGITAAVWIKPDGAGEANSAIFQKAYSTITPFSSYAVYQDGGGARAWAGRINVGGTAFITTTTNNLLLNDLEWYFAVLRWSSGNVAELRIYNSDGTLNQVVNSLSAATGTISYTTDPLGIGSSIPPSIIRSWSGNVDEVRVWNRALSDQEILENLNYKRQYHRDIYDTSLYDDSLVLMMNLDNRGSLGESPTVIKDVSTYGNDGSCVGGTCPIFDSAGRYGGAFKFDGVDDYIDLGASSILNTNIDDITISAWVKLDAEIGSINTNYEIFTNELLPSYGYEFRIQNNLPLTSSIGTILLRFSRSGSDSSVLTPINTYPNDHQWHHVVGIKNGLEAYIYLDGVMVGSNTGILPPANSPDSSRISGIDQPMYGSIDEVRVWNRALSTREVNVIYNSNLYKFNETQWYMNFGSKSLADADYNYFSYASDFTDNYNQTDTERFIVDSDVSTCGIISVPGAYLLSAPVSSTGTCFEITNDNVFIDCQGNNVRYAASGAGGYGFDIKSNVNYTTIKNCNIIGTSGSNHIGIYALESRGAVIDTNTISTLGTTSKGIFLDLGDYNAVRNNIIVSSGNGAHGIHLLSGFNNIIEGNSIDVLSSNFGVSLELSSSNRVNNNIITGSGADGDSISLQSGSSFNELANNDISTSAANDGISLTTDANFNTIINNTIVTSAVNGIGMSLGSSSNNIVNNSISTSGAGAHGLLLYTGDNTIVNNTVIISGTGAGIYFSSSSSDDTLITGTDIKTSLPGAYAVSVSGGSHDFIVKDSVFNTGLEKDFFIAGAVTGGTWDFINVSRFGLAEGSNSIETNWLSGGVGRLNVYWYVDAIAIDVTSPLPNALIEARENAQLYFSLLTGADGRIPRQKLLEFTQTGPLPADIYTFGNYEFTATAPPALGYTPKTQSHLMNRNRNLAFVFGGGIFIMDIVIGSTQTIAPGANNPITFTFLVAAESLASLIDTSATASFTNVPYGGVVTRSDEICDEQTPVDDAAARTRKYTCKIDILYHDRSGPFDVTAQISNTLPATATLTEQFILMSTAYAKPNDISWTVATGALNAETLFKIDNWGNVEFPPAGMKVKANSNLLEGGVGPGNIPATDIGFNYATNPSACGGVGEDVDITGIGNDISLNQPLPYTPGSASFVNLYACLAQVPTGKPAGTTYISPIKWELSTIQSP